MIGTALANSFLDTNLVGYLSAHTGDPDSTGANEVAGGSYARQLVTGSFNPASGKIALSNADVNFAGMPTATVTYLGLWSAVTSGTFKIGGPMTVPVSVALGATLKLSAGDLSGIVT